MRKSATDIERISMTLSMFCRLGCLFFMLLYLSMMALGSLPVWRQEGLLFHRCVPGT